MKRRFTILGCGSPGGGPGVGGRGGVCAPTTPKTRRRRCSLLIEQIGPDGTTSALIDTSPDLRSQLLDANVGRLDGVIYTHSHADHVHGIDDLRMIVFNMKERLAVWADGDTTDNLISRFGYAFVQPEGSPYPSILTLKSIKGLIEIKGPGGTIPVIPFKANHGTIDALGVRVDGLAYLPDVADFYHETWAALQGLDCFIIDALRRTPHPSHSHLANTLEWIDKLAPKRAVITNMHIDLDYATLDAETPDHITPAYDGMTIEYDL